MRSILLGLFLVACAIGCEVKKAPDEAPNVQVNQPGVGGPGVTIPSGDLLASKIVGMDYAKLWNPKDSQKPDPAALAKTAIAIQHFAKHQTKYLAPAIVGTSASSLPGGLHAVVAQTTLTAAYPGVAKDMEAKWQDLLTEGIMPSRAVLDASNSGIGPSARQLVIRVKCGKDEVPGRFSEYLTRLEEAVKGTGATVVGHQRGAMRTHGSLSDIRYEIGNRTGNVRSVVVNTYDESDTEFKNLILGDGVKDDKRGLFKAVMHTENGPYLIVTINERQR